MMEHPASHAPPSEPSALRLTWPTRGARALARALVLTALAVLGVCLLAPWQQSVQGHGRVIAHAPLDRPQALEAPIEGRVVEWMVEEGSRVRAGEAIARLADNDPDVVARIERERDAARTRLDASRLAADLTEQRIEALQSAQRAAGDAAGARVRMASDRAFAAEQAVDAAEAGLTAARLNLDRTRGLTAEGLASQRGLELAELSEQTARAEVQRARAALAAARREVGAMQGDQARVVADAGASVDAARSALQTARGEQARAEQELARIEVRLARQRSQTITAPRDGTVLRLLARQGAEMVAAGDPVALFVPETDDRAVELWVDGLDAPLITPGRRARLQFEGWPAVQFVGWPSVAVGTFAGEVAFVDATDDGAGRFRVVVVPDPAAPGDERWPPAQYLRQGVRANGWILLDEVSLGFELWRQFNGFPPVVTPAPGAERPAAKPSGDKEGEA